MLKAFINSTIFTGTEKLTGKAVLVRNGLVDSLIDKELVPETTEKIDCGNKYLAPGLIDLQIAGAGGYLFSSYPSAETLRVISRAIVRTGTTGFLIAMPTNTFEVYHKVISVIKENKDSAVLGLHFEGPYISTHRRGAHIRQCIRVPVSKEVEALLDEASGAVKMVTVAPEVCGEGIIELINRKGMIAAAGHSNATFKEAKYGFERGIKTATHLFNAMSQLHHRDPGLPGAVFLANDVMASIIADGIHVDYNMITIAKKILKERLFLVSDAVEEDRNGATPHVRRQDRFTLPDGTLSGSLLTMMKAVRNCVHNTGISLEESLRMASTYPAALMNLHDRGRIEAGCRADLILLDKNLEINDVYINGDKII